MTLYIVKASDYLNVKRGWLRIWRKLDNNGNVTSESVESWHIYASRKLALDKN